ncbi:MAG: LapA family protein [Propionivibrio sp.]|uniref:LapA family protein n=1 Tax=Candidatus Propionivibrio dominans TaxID=2954373 RepID=A0A9D7FCU9_9RHOO|nr:LapA family protein [Candidatus Propionivibrio dominans]
MQLLTIAAMLIAACGVILALQNNIPVVVTFLLWRFDSSLAMVLLLTLALGGFIVALVSTPATLRRQWAATRQNKRITELENTCNEQKDTIADLERRVPAVEPAPEVSRPYVGLKQFIGSIGIGNSDSQNPPPIV